MKAEPLLGIPETVPTEFRKMTAREASEHRCLEGDEQCYYLWTYDESPENPIRRLIFDLKARPATPRRDRRAKTIAICAAVLGAALARARLDRATVVPMPPSSGRGGPDYDPRLRTILDEVRPPLLEIREIIEQPLSTRALVKGITPAERAALWRLTGDAALPEPQTIVVFDDVIAGGSHFKAAEMILRRRFPSSQIIGVFLARRALCRVPAAHRRIRKRLISLSGRSLDEVSEDALTALVMHNRPPSLMVRGGELVRLRERASQAPSGPQPAIDRLTVPALRGLLARAGRFTVKRSWGRQVVDPPLSVVHDLLSLPAWPFPELRGIVSGPVIRSDGTILDREGYDEATGLILCSHAAEQFAQPKGCPTEEEISAARALLLGECLGDFPFVSESDRAHAVALLLTPILRPSVPCVPMAVIDAPTPGTGKGLLASIAALIATGREAGKGTMPSDPAEVRKTITAALLAAQQFIIFDNLTEPLSSPDLAAALTAEVWRDRLLGHSRELLLPNMATWVVTGNRVRLKGDIPRRCFWIRLDAGTNRPWLRDGFRKQNLREWVRANRVRLLHALVTLIRNYFSNRGIVCPSAVLGGVEGWSRTVGGILDAARIPGFLDGRPAQGRKRADRTNELRRCAGTAGMDERRHKTCAAG